MWAVVAGKQLVATFKEFALAAKYANEHLPDQQVLIRHTEKREEFVPLGHMSPLLPLVGCFAY